MIEASNTTDSKTEAIYPFRFGTSDKLVHLTQQQLDRIPYLSTLVAHKVDFSSIQNENGEYVLNYPIEYTWFIPILRSITSEQPYTLLNELSEHDNVSDTLQLFDYLGINSFPMPLLKNEDLVRSNPTNTGNQKTRVEYQKASILEARQTAAEFIIAISKNEYNLHDSYTVERIFFLIRVILSNAAVFSSRFRHHTLIVTKECCYSFFSKKQQHLLPTTQQIAQYSKIDSFMYLYDDEKPLPDDFQNTFAWRGVYVPIEEKQTNPLSAPRFEDTFSDDIPSAWTRRYIIILRELILSIRPSFISEDLVDKELPIYQTKQDRKNNQAQSARSTRFNTLPKPPKMDKFKHRCGPKAQKYR